MKLHYKKYNRDVPNSELILDLKAVAARLNKEAVTIDEYNKHGNFHSSTLSRRFGSWFKALEEAGLKKTRNLHISDKEYFDNLKDVWIKLGRQPKYEELKKPFSKYSASSYEKKFGSFSKALEKFIESVDK